MFEFSHFEKFVFSPLGDALMTSQTFKMQIVIVHSITPITYGGKSSSPRTWEGGLFFSPNFRPIVYMNLRSAISLSNRKFNKTNFKLDVSTTRTDTGAQIINNA